MKIISTTPSADADTPSFLKGNFWIGFAELVMTNGYYFLTIGMKEII